MIRVLVNVYSLLFSSIDYLVTRIAIKRILPRLHPPNAYYTASIGGVVLISIMVGLSQNNAHSFRLNLFF